MTQMKQIEDSAGNVVEVTDGAGAVELSVASSDYTIDETDGAVSFSLVLTPRQARLLARQLLQQADDTEGDDEG